MKRYDFFLREAIGRGGSYHHPLLKIFFRGELLEIVVISRGR